MRLRLRIAVNRFRNVMIGEQQPGIGEPVSGHREGSIRRNCFGITGLPDTDAEEDTSAHQDGSSRQAIRSDNRKGCNENGRVHAGSRP